MEICPLTGMCVRERERERDETVHKKQMCGVFKLKFEAVPPVISNAVLCTPIFSRYFGDVTDERWFLTSACENLRQ